jgi:ligand-binding sensor domain-containing protein
MQQSVSQTLEFERFTTKDGLISDEVYNMHQDKKGYLWIFSRFGTVKFDGSRFKPVLKNLAFKESFIYTLYENDKGQKWVANSNARIFEIRNDSAFLLKGVEDMSVILKKQVSEIFKLFVDDSLNIYVITKGYSYKLVKKGDRYHSINLNDLFKNDSIITQIIDLRKEVLVLVNRKMMDGLTYINKKKTQTYLEIIKANKKSIVINPIYNLKVRNFNTHIRNLKKYDNKYFFIYSNLLGEINEEDSFSFTQLKSVALNFIRDKYGHFWVSCLNDGIFELESQGKVVGHYLGNTTVNDILIDHQGGVWATTPGLGLYHCENVTGKIFNKESPLGASISQVKIINNVLYVTNIRGEIMSIFDNKIKKIRNADNTEVHEIEIYKNELIISNISGIIKLISGKQKQMISHNLSLVFHKTLSKGKDTLMGCTRKTITYIINEEIKKVIYFNKRLFSFELYDGLLWMATDDGIYQFPAEYAFNSKIHNGITVYDTAELKQPKYLEATLSAIITKIVKDKKNCLWFCSQGNGLYSVYNRQLKNYTVHDGLPDNIINNLFFADNDCVLLSTNSGLYLSKTGIPEKNSARWEKIYSGAVQGSVLYDGKIYIATIEGLIILDYGVKGNDGKIFFNLASVIIDSKEIDPTSFTMIKSSQRTLELNFDLINFNKDRPRIKYYLIGSQADSGYIDGTHLRFGQLKPGNHTLTAYPDIPSGKLAKLTIPFFVEPAFWETTIFRVFFILGLALLIFLSVGLIIRYNRRKEAARIKNEQLILEYKLIALKAQINPHFMSNCLSAIQDLIVNNNSEKATFYVAQFGLMVRQILDFSSKQLISLDEELDLLSIYLELEQLRFENKFNFKIQIEDSISLKETFLPPLILNPIVENAIWHGLLPIQNQKQGELHIAIRIESNNLLLCIEDNGVGLDTEKKEISNNKSNSYGIKITEQRLNNINYLYDRTDSKIVYTNLLNKDNESLGTRVMIYLPDNLVPSQYEQN